MKWLLVIVLVNSVDGVAHQSVPFESRDSCVEAARAVVERFPGFEWREPQTEYVVEKPFLRPHLRCVRMDERHANRGAGGGR